MSDFPIQVERLFTRQDARTDARKKGGLAAQAPASEGEKVGEGAEAYRFEISAEWWQARDPENPIGLLEIETPFCFEITAEARGESIQIAGDLQGLVALECSRCAKRYSHPLRESFRLLLESAKTAGAGGPGTDRNAGRMDPEGEQALAEHGLCLGEDLEAGWFKGPVIGLDDFLGEVIALAIPLQPLCDEACPGVCSHCGADFAENRCDCEDEKIESPFAALAALKTNKD